MQDLLPLVQESGDAPPFSGGSVIGTPFARRLPSPEASGS